VRHAFRRDGNEGDVIATLNASGYHTLPVNGVPFDLIVWRTHGKCWLFLEVKTRLGRLTKLQQRFSDQTQGLPWAAVKSPEAALEAAKQWLGEK